MLAAGAKRPQEPQIAEIRNNRVVVLGRLQDLRNLHEALVLDDLSKGGLTKSALSDVGVAITF